MPLTTGCLYYYYCTATYELTVRSAEVEGGTAQFHNAQHVWKVQSNVFFFPDVFLLYVRTSDLTKRVATPPSARWAPISPVRFWPSEKWAIGFSRPVYFLITGEHNASFSPTSNLAWIIKIVLLMYVFFFVFPAIEPHLYPWTQNVASFPASHRWNRDAFVLNASQQAVPRFAFTHWHRRSMQHVWAASFSVTASVRLRVCACHSHVDMRGKVQKKNKKTRISSRGGRRRKEGGGFRGGVEEDATPIKFAPRSPPWQISRRLPRSRQNLKINSRSDRPQRRNRISH